MENNENYIKPRMIPDNVTDSGRILNGLVRTRNLIEGMVIAAPLVWLVLKFFHFNDPVYKVLAVILAAGFPIFISLVLPTYSPFELLWIVLQYQRTKHYAKYNPRLKWEKMPDYLIQSRLDPIEAIRDFGERMIKERASREAIINENITNPTHDERFIEDRKYLEDRDLVPDELKSSAQLKAEKRERKKQEKELRAEQNRQIREAKKREREEKKSSRKKEFLTEEKGEDNGV